MNTEGYRKHTIWKLGIVSHKTVVSGLHKSLLYMKYIDIVIHLLSNYTIQI